MKKLYVSFIIALSMYSKIPVPKTDWDKNCMKYSLCFIPFVGLIISAVILLWYKFCCAKELTSVLFASGAVIIPILISGGIHMDGFVDSCDGINSYLEPEKRLEILKDVHVGAFALIMCNVYFIALFGLWNQAFYNRNTVLFSCIGFVLSRAFAPLFQLTIKCAKGSGLAKIFSESADKKIVSALLIFWVLICIAFAFYVDFKSSIISFALLLLLFLKFIKICKSYFGGITGDLCGYILQLIELFILISAALGSVLF